MEHIDFRVEKLSQMFNILSDTARLNIVIFLMNGEKSVSEITEYLGMSQSAVSHQLRILRDSRILKASKKGKKVIYSINDNHVKTIVNNGLVHMVEH